MTKQYHLGDILSVTTGILISPRHMEGIYDILGYLTGENLFTHQLPRACKECRPHLKAQLPHLADIQLEVLDGQEECQKVLTRLVEEYGEMHEVSPLGEAQYRAMDPVEELIEMKAKPSSMGDEN